MRILKIVGCFGLFWGLMACKSDKPPVQPSTPYPQHTTGVWVVNEGNFMFGNADVSFYDPVTHQVANEVFSQANQLPLGDVLQSMYFGADSLVYLMVNNSSKIEIVHQRDFKTQGRITGLTAPRYMEVVGNKAYVTDLYAHGVHILNLTSQQKTGFVPLRGWTEAVVLQDDFLWISNMQTGKIYALDTQTDLWVDSIEVGQEPNSMCLDAAGHLWVLCGGKAATPGSLWKIDLQNRTVLKNWPFTANSNKPNTLVYDSRKNQLLWINGAIFSMDVATENWPPNVYIPADGRNFYGLACAPNGDLFVSDAMDYVRRGRVFRFDNNGKQLQEFQVGVIPSRFYFSKN